MSNNPSAGDMEDESQDISHTSQQAQTEQSAEQDTLMSSLLALRSALQRQHSGTDGSGAGHPLTALQETNQRPSAEENQEGRTDANVPDNRDSARGPSEPQTSNDNPWAQALSALTKSLPPANYQQPHTAANAGYTFPSSSANSQNQGASIPPEIRAFARQITGQQSTQLDQSGVGQPPLPQDVHMEADSKTPASSSPHQTDELDEDHASNLRDPISNTTRIDASAPNDTIRALATGLATMIQHQQQEAARKAQRQREEESVRALIQAFQTRSQPSNAAQIPFGWSNSTTDVRQPPPSSPHALSTAISSLLGQFNVPAPTPTQMEMQQSLATLMTALFQAFISYAQSQGAVRVDPSSTPAQPNPLSTLLQSLLPPSVNPPATATERAIPANTQNDPASFFGNLLQQHAQQARPRGQTQKRQRTGIESPSVARAAPAIELDDDDDSEHAMETHSRPRRKKKRIYRHESFPMKLHRLLTTLEAEGQGNIASFVEDGTAFRIHQHLVFEQDIIPRFFRHTKLRSFSRQLNMYGFQRVAEGTNAGAFTHPLFLRDKPELCKTLERGGETAQNDKDSIQI